MTAPAAWSVARTRSAAVVAMLVAGIASCGTEPLRIGQGNVGAAGCTTCADTCADLENDPHHCGACDRDCGTTACLQGACEVQTLVSGSVGPHALYANNDNKALYWNNFDQGGLFTMPSRGGPVTRLADLPPWVFALAGAGNDLYFTNFRAGAVSRVDLSTGGISDVVSGIAPAEGLALRDGVLYWGTDLGGSKGYPIGSVWRARTDGTGLTMLAQTPRANWIATSNTSLYVTSFGDGKLASLPITGAADSGAPGERILAEGLGAPWGLAVREPEVFWVDSSPARLMRVNTQTGEVMVLQHGGVSAHSILLVGATLYWSDWGEGTIWRVPVPEGALQVTPRAIAHGQDRPKSLVAAAGWIYWVTEGGQLVRTMP